MAISLDGQTIYMPEGEVSPFPANWDLIQRLTSSGKRWYVLDARDGSVEGSRRRVSSLTLICHVKLDERMIGQLQRTRLPSTCRRGRDVECRLNDHWGQHDRSVASSRDGKAHGRLVMVPTDPAMIRVETAKKVLEIVAQKCKEAAPIVTFVSGHEQLGDLLMRLESSPEFNSVVILGCNGKNLRTLNDYIEAGRTKLPM